MVLRLPVRIRRGAPVLLLLPLLLAVQGHAQTEPGTSAAQQKASAYRRMAKACQAESLRFCPAAAQPEPEPREEVICLKAYRADLSLGCRGAVDAARK